MTLVKCDIVDCKFNTNFKCTESVINLGINHDSEGICHIECTNYQADISKHNNNWINDMIHSLTGK